MKRLVLVTALLTVLAGAPALAAKKPAAKPTATAAVPAQTWVQRSNDYAQVLLKVQAQFSPESAGFWGVTGYDDKVADLGPKVGERQRAALVTAKADLQGALAVEKDQDVRQDLLILVHAADQSIEGSTLNEKYLLPWVDAPELIFSGMNSLLSKQVPAERQAKAVDRLRAYTGLAPGSTPITELAKQRYTEKLSNKTLLQPTKLEVERAVDNVATYATGIRKLFTEYRITGPEADKALAAMDKQVKDYGNWTKKTVLPKARLDTKLPPELYAFQLKQVGIDIAPALLMQRAQLSFMETRSQMQALAPLVAKAKGLQSTDYLGVIRELKKGTIPNDQLEAYYRTVLDQIDPIIVRERIVEVPKRPMAMRLGSDAESASQPAPHFLPAPLIGNTGQQGTFVLPVGNPGKDKKAAQYDDFNFSSVAWTLSAHEGRPGHELQFTAMVERGISLARTLFAFNSVNVEGWALYAEAEMVPYEPLDGQLIALQFRLLRAARAMLDPMLNLGLTDRESARKVLEEKVGLSAPMARQELDRYTFNSPGQAGSYFYGYSRIMELRMRTELALGDRFDRKSFNDFLLDQGLLPPDQLADAVQNVFVPAQLKQAPAKKAKKK